MAGLLKKGTYTYQINQLDSENSYIVLHPETEADVVIESATRVFFTPAERATLETLSGLKGSYLTYKGNYSSSADYKVHDVISYQDQMYICIADTTGDFIEASWIKINKVADRAKLADKATDADTLGGKEESELEVAKAVNADHATNADHASNADNATQAANAAKLNDKLESELEVAKAVVAVSYNSNEKVVDGVTIPSETINIADKMDQLDQTISGIQGGGTFTANKLTVTKDGANGVEFDGSSPVTVDIKQTYATDDISDLLDAQNKIDAKWLPDSIVGQLEYQGAWSAKVDGYVPAKGHYFIAGAEVSVNPDGSAAASTYHVGDWAVYNGSNWDKIDNTDAVTMVNGQIGAVETYKGDYVAGNTYYKGDIAKYGDKYYICLANTSASAWDSAAWGMLGATYSSVENNPVVVEGFAVKHAEIEAVTENVEEATVINQNSEFVIPVISRDDYGHITKITNQKYNLDASGVDTVRPVKVNGVDVYDDKTKTALDLAGDNTYITAANVNGQITFSHKTNTNVIGDLTVDAIEKLQAGQSFKVPSIEIDGAGHIVNAELKEIKLGEASIAHELFDIKTVNSVQTIGAYKNIDDIANLDALKFYQGTAVPTATDALKLNGAFVATELYQGANKVVDQSAKIYAGNGYNAETGKFDRALEGSFDAANNRFAMAETGVASGTYSAVYVNRQGLVTAGGQMVEFGTTVGADPSASLAVGGLFFRKLSE